MLLLALLIAVPVSFFAGVVLASQVKAALSALKDKLKVKADAELATVEAKVKEKF